MSGPHLNEMGFQNADVCEGQYSALAARELHLKGALAFKKKKKDISLAPKSRAACRFQVHPVHSNGCSDGMSKR
jgi:hypothetical protein